MIREQLLSPTPLELTAFLLRHTRTRDCLVQVAGLAEVTYHGRAASTADVGAYLVLLKRDSSVQIHAPKGVKPMNWQPRTDEITALVEDDRAVLLASRRSPTELVRVVFLEPHLAQALELTEEAGFTLRLRSPDAGHARPATGTHRTRAQGAGPGAPGGIRGH
ncbi:hypothetical protein [Deinococcus apachensis]|uniref:hypothetical protein n=1 Tax=Deinococcus apachensis TaxID=309886 RepID=UPI00316AD569